MQEQGIQDVVTALYEQNYKRLYWQGMNFFGGKKEWIEDVEECVQDVFLETYYYSCIYMNNVVKFTSGDKRWN